MRWDHLRLDGTAEAGPDESPEAGPGRAGPGGALFERGAITRTFDTPGFRGMTFYEIQAKSIVNRVPATSRMAFELDDQPLPRLPACMLLLPRAVKRPS